MAQMSPFQLFGMKPAFMIDEAKLEAAYQFFINLRPIFYMLFCFFNIVSYF